MTILNRNFVFLSFFMLLSLVACKTQDTKDKEMSAEKPLTKEELIKSIKYMEDSIIALQKNPKTANKIPSLTQLELINRLKSYYRYFPNDAYSAECLFKIHIKYSDLKAQ